MNQLNYNLFQKIFGCNLDIPNIESVSHSYEFTEYDYKKFKEQSFILINNKRMYEVVYDKKQEKYNRLYRT